MPKPGAAGGDFRRSLDGEPLERADALARRAGLVGDRLELRAMVDGERHQSWRLSWRARRRPMDVVERLVMAKRPMRRADLAGNGCSSAKVGYSAEQSRRETAKAPPALAKAQQVSIGSSRSQPRRKPDMKASPAPSTL